MTNESLGELIPVGGGDTIPLGRTPLTLGRRESCDICLQFPNVSGKHCQLVFEEGVWFLHDLKSTNGVKVNGMRVTRKPLQPGDTITIAKRSYTIQYNLTRKLSELQDFMDDVDGILDVPLLEKAGLEKPTRPDPRRRPTRADDD